MLERVILTGPHSCGKTTLANALIADWGDIFAQNSEPSLLTEVARTVMATQGFTRQDVGKLAFQSAIMEAQLNREATISKPYVSDRCILDPMAYALHQSSSAAHSQPPSPVSDTGSSDSESSVSSTASNYHALRHRSGADDTLTVYRDPRRTLIILLEPVEEFAVDDGTRKVVENMDEWWECCRAFENVLEDAGITNVKRLGRETKELGARVQKVKEWVQAA